MAEREGLSLSIATKSNQVVRDIDVIKRIAERSSITIHMTVTTMRTRLARMLEPRAPRPDLRLAALAQLRAAGIDAGVNAMPVLPGLTDREEDLDALARGAASRRSMDRSKRPVSHAVVAKGNAAVHRRKIPKASEALPRVVFAQRLRSGILPQRNLRPLRSSSPQ